MEGRIGRCDFWFRLGVVGISFCVILVLGWFGALALHILHYDKQGNFVGDGISYIASIVFVALFVLSVVWSVFCVFGQRMHDLGFSSKFVGLCCIPYVGFLIFLYLACFKGNKESNSYGESRLSRPDLMPSKGKIIAAVAMNIIFVFMFLTIDQARIQINQRVKDGTFLKTAAP